MSRTFSTLTLGLLVALTGCPSGDDTSTTTVADDSTTTAGTTGSGTNTTPGTTDGSADTTAGTNPGSTTDTPGTTTDDPGTTTDETASTTDEPGTSTGGTADACAECVQTQCGDELAACMMDADCTCFQDCAEKNPGIPGALMCASTCEIPLPQLQDETTVVGALAVCTQDFCPKCVM